MSAEEPRDDSAEAQEDQGTAQEEPRDDSVDEQDDQGTAQEEPERDEEAAAKFEAAEETRDSARESLEGQDEVEPDDARTLVAAGEVLLLDVRSDEERTAGTIAGSRRFDPDGDDLEQQVGAIEEKRILVVCADGERSREVAERLREEGRETAVVKGGFSNWAGDRLPLQPSEDPAEPEGAGGDPEAPASTENQAPAETEPGRGDEPAGR